MKRMWTAGVLALLVAAVAATPASAVAGGNSANAKLCQNDGWKTLYRGDGSTFASQGDCVSYAAQGNTIQIEAPNAWQAACEQIGGTFEVLNVDIHFRPLTPPAYAYFCVPVTDSTWTRVLTPICFGYPDAVVSEWTQAGGSGIGNCIRSGTTQVS